MAEPPSTQSLAPVPSAARPSSLKRWGTAGLLLRLLVALIAAWFFGLAVMSAGYVYHLVHPPCAPVTVPVPSGTREVEIASRGGYSLKGWWQPGENGAVIILLGGHGDNRAAMRPEADFLAGQGYGVLTLDYRSCAGRIATLGFREVDDLAGAVDFIQAENPSARIGVFGFSVGGITAIRGAARIDSVRAVAAAGGFSSLTHEITGGDPPLLSITWTIQRWTLVFYSLMTGVFPGQVNPAADIARLSPRPVLLIYGEREMSGGDARIEYDAAGDPRQLWVVPGAGHGEYLQAQPVAYPAHLIAFFDHWLLK